MLIHVRAGGILIVIISFNPWILQCGSLKFRGGSEVSQGTSLRSAGPRQASAISPHCPLYVLHLSEGSCLLGTMLGASYTAWAVSLPSVKWENWSTDWVSCCPRTLIWFWQCRSPSLLQYLGLFLALYLGHVDKFPKSDQHNDGRRRGQHSVDEKGSEFLYIYRVNSGNLLLDFLL